LRQGIIDGAYWLRRTGAELPGGRRLRRRGRAGSDRGGRLMAEDRRDVGLLAVTSADRLNAGWTAAQRARERGLVHARSHIERCSPRSAAALRAGHRAGRPPGDAGLARRGHGHRVRRSGSSISARPARSRPLPALRHRKPVRVIVTVPAGGGVDTVTRIITDRLREKLGQNFVVENRGGAGGNIGAEAVYQSEPDGYTLMASQPSPITTNVVLYKKLNFDPTKFVPVALMSSAPNMLLVKNDFPAKNLQEFMAYVKANPAKVNYASQGPGTTSHLTAELFNKVAGAKMTHVPYKGTGPALNDIVAGHVDLIFMQAQAALRLHQSGKARILAVTTQKRVGSLPNIPTMAEAGLKDFISDTWNAISAPPNTPPAIANKLNAAINEVLKMPEVLALFNKMNLEPGGGSPEDMAKVVKSDTERWGAVIREANIPQI
jgi:tripartite-type tricarboxylate transporter receptor subunit TctC